MKISDKGYIDSPEDIEDALDKALDITVAEMNVPERYNAVLTARRSLAVNDVPCLDFDKSTLSEEYIGRLKFSELLALAGHSDPYDGFNLPAELCELLYYAASVSFGVKLFTAISVKAFTDYIDIKNGGSRGAEIYRSICETAMEKLSLTIDETFTLQKLFGKLKSVMSYHTVQIDINIFADSVRYSCEILKEALTDSIRLVRPEVFDFESLKKRICEDTGVKYEKDNGVCFTDGSEDIDDFDFDDEAFEIDDDDFLPPIDDIGGSDDDDFDDLDYLLGLELAYKRPTQSSPAAAENKAYAAPPPANDLPSWDEVVAPFRRLAERKQTVDQ